MSKPTPTAHEWCENLQARLMKAMDAAWADAEQSPDPVVVAKALARARLCGQMAASARKVAALTPAKPRAAGPVADLVALSSSLKATLAETPPTQAEIARTALERLKAGGGRRGRL